MIALGHLEQIFFREICTSNVKLISSEKLIRWRFQKKRTPLKATTNPVIKTISLLLITL